MEEENFQAQIIRYLILIFIGGIIFLMVSFWFFKPKPSFLFLVEIPFQKINIDFEFLSSDKLKELSSFEEISLPNKIGRENPFISY